MSKFLKLISQLKLILQSFALYRETEIPMKSSDKYSVIMINYLNDPVCYCWHITSQVRITWDDLGLKRDTFYH